jgi:hypothetical protein
MRRAKLVRQSTCAPTVADLHTALDDPEARTEAAEILRRLVERITVRAGAQGHVVELTGDIVKLLALPCDPVPSPFESSVKVVAGARNHLDLQLAKLLAATLGTTELAALSP